MLLEMYVKGKTLLWGLRERFTREDGAVATEYGLLIVLIALAIIVAAYLLGQAISRVFGDATESLGGVGGGGGS
jgi:pilus assembly protein Flp/PilA